MSQGPAFLDAQVDGFRGVDASRLPWASRVPVLLVKMRSASDKDNKAQLKSKTCLKMLFLSFPWPFGNWALQHTNNVYLYFKKENPLRWSS